jgi:predicted DNA-binding protein
MSNTITVRLPDELAKWLRDLAKRTGLPAGQIIRDELERARNAAHHEKKYLRLAGIITDAPPDLSQRKGFARK